MPFAKPNPGRPADEEGKPRPPASDQVLQDKAEPLDVKPGPLPRALRPKAHAHGLEAVGMTESLHQAASSSGRPGARSMLERSAQRIVEMEAKEAMKEMPLEPGSVAIDEKTVRKAFQTFDLDNNEIIDAAELRHLFSQLGEMPTDEEIDAMIFLCDPRGEGVVNFEDFVAVFTMPNEALRLVDRTGLQDVMKGKRPTRRDSVIEEEDEEDDSSATSEEDDDD